jgi:hypothetical protein
MKAVQVLATYFGERRTYPFNIDNTIKILNKQIENLKTIDTGYDSDLLIVNHDNGSVKGNEFLKQVENTILKNGIVRILNRPIINHDVSFGSYKYAFYKYQNEYDFWFFNEDDILPMTNNFIGDMIDLLKNDSNVGFIAALQFVKGINITSDTHTFKFDENNYIISTGNHQPHAHGGVGVTSTSIIKDIVNKFPSYLDTPNINYNGNSTLSGGYGGDGLEVDFTNIFVKAGYKIKCYSDGAKFTRLQDGRSL